MDAEPRRLCLAVASSAGGYANSNARSVADTDCFSDSDVESNRLTEPDGVTDIDTYWDTNRNPHAYSWRSKGR